MGKTFKPFRRPSSAFTWRMAIDGLIRACRNPADVVTALRGVPGWGDILTAFENRLPFAWKPGQREWVCGELEKHDAEEQRKREEAAAREVDWRCTVCPETWRGDRSLPVDCQKCGAPGELALEVEQEAAP